MRSLEIRRSEDVEPVFAQARHERIDTLLVRADPLTLVNRQQIVRLAAQHKVIAMYSAGEFVRAGGLVSYAVPLTVTFRGAAMYLDKILRGGKPADLAVEQPTKFELLINLKTAKLLAQLGEAYLPIGRFDEAGEAARQARELARKRSERGSEAWAMRLLGEIHACQDPANVERAGAAYAESIARAEELGMRPLVAHCHLGLGRLYRRTGKREQAQEHLTTATTMYREMEMTYWVEKAEAELRPLA